MFINLFKREVEKLQKGTIIFSSIIFLINLYTFYGVYTAKNISEEGMVGELVAVVALNGMFLGIGFFTSLIASSNKVFGSEWKNNTIYLTMSLPVSTEKKFLAKICAVVASYVTNSLTIFILLAIELMMIINKNGRFNLLSPAYDLFTIDNLIACILLFIVSVGAYLYVLNIVVLAETIGKLFKKYKAIISIVIGYFLMYFGIKIVGFFNSGWFVNIFHSGNYQMPKNILGAIWLGSIYEILIFTVLSSVIWLITSKLYDRKIEI